MIGVLHIYILLAAYATLYKLISGLLSHATSVQVVLTPPPVPEGSAHQFVAQLDDGYTTT